MPLSYPHFLGKSPFFEDFIFEEAKESDTIKAFFAKIASGNLIGRIALNQGDLVTMNNLTSFALNEFKAKKPGYISILKGILTSIEEALWPHDYEGYRKLSEGTNTRIVCGENETTRFGFKTLIEYGKVAFVQPDISRCGGFTEAKKIAALAELHSINVVPHCWSSGIVEAAALHLIASVPNANLLEYDVYPSALRFDIVPDDIEIKDGYATVPNGPGLGIKVSDEAIEKYRCDEIPEI